MVGVDLTELGDLLRAAASLLWVGVAVAVLLIFRRLLSDRGSLSKLGVGPSGVTMEFRERTLDAAVAGADPAVRAVVGDSAKRSVLDRLERMAPQLAAARILWADDHPENVTSLVDLLRSYRAAVDVVTSNEAALRLLEGTRYDAVVSDVRRDDEGPDGDLKGVELAEAVFRRQHIQTILFTAAFDPTRLPGATDAERLELVRRMSRSVAGYTSRTDEALHLLLDQIDR